MTMKSSAYNFGSKVLFGASVAPRFAGEGFVAIGNKLLGIADYLSNKAAVWDAYSKGLELLAKGDITGEQVKAVMDGKRYDFQTAVAFIVIESEIATNKKADITNNDNDNNSDDDKEEDSTAVAEPDITGSGEVGAEQTLGEEQKNFNFDEWYNDGKKPVEEKQPSVEEQKPVPNIKNVGDTGDNDISNAEYSSLAASLC